MNKSKLYLPIFTHLVIHETYDGALQFVTLDEEVINRIRAESNKYGFGSFSDRDDGQDVGKMKRAYLYINWLFDLREVAQYLADIAKCEYAIEYRLGPRQEYERVRGDSSE